MSGVLKSEHYDGVDNTAAECETRLDGIISITMLNIQNVNSLNNNYIGKNRNDVSTPIISASNNHQNNKNIKNVNADNLKAYHPSFTSIFHSNKPINFNQNPEQQEQFDAIKARLDKKTIKHLENLANKGILLDNNSNDGSTVLDNLYKITIEPRIKGLDENIILAETIKALDNPFSITQKFGDINDEAESQIMAETGEKIPENAKNVVSSACVAASMEFNLADRKPAEFARFAADLSSKNYSVDKHIKIKDFSESFTEGIWKLRAFNTTNKIGSNKNWDDVSIKLKPDRNAIIRARVQTSYKDPGERSCVDVLIQSAILNFASQNTYNAITDERTGKFNPDKTGLTDFEKNFAEQVLFETPKLSVIYQNLDENGILIGYNCSPEETKQHILKSLELGQNVIIGYTHLDANKHVNGGHEITIIGYEQNKNGDGNFICNDTDDELDKPIKINEKKLIPLIHHAGISKEALNPDDVIVSPWREYISEFKNILTKEQKK